MAKSKSKSINYAKKSAAYKVVHKKEDREKIESRIAFYVEATCPHCKKEITLRNEKEGRRKELSKCSVCNKDIVVKIDHYQTDYYYHIDILKVIE